MTLNKTISLPPPEYNNAFHHGLVALQCLTCFALACHLTNSITKKIFDDNDPGFSLSDILWEHVISITAFAVTQLKLVRILCIESETKRLQEEFDRELVTFLEKYGLNTSIIRAKIFESTRITHAQVRQLPFISREECEEQFLGMMAKKVRHTCKKNGWIEKPTEPSSPEEMTHKPIHEPKNKKTKGKWGRKKKSKKKP